MLGALTDQGLVRVCQTQRPVCANVLGMFSALMNTYLMFSLASKRPVLSKMTPESQLEGPMGLGRGEGTAASPPTPRPGPFPVIETGGPGLHRLSGWIAPRPGYRSKPGGTVEERFGRKGVSRVTPVSHLPSDCDTLYAPGGPF